MVLSIWSYACLRHFKTKGTEEVVQWLGAQTALAEDPGSQDPCWTADCSLLTPASRSKSPAVGCWSPWTHCTHILTYSRTDRHWKTHNSKWDTSFEKKKYSPILIQRLHTNVDLKLNAWKPQTGTNLPLISEWINYM